MLELDSVDAGNGWLIFALPPAEVAVHPDTVSRHQLYLMCDDLDATLAALKARGVTVKPEVHDERWGRLATLVLPGGGDLPIYEPKHPSPPR